MRGAPPIRFSQGRVARNSDLALWVERGQARLLVTLVISAPSAEADFCPLTVDYYERSSAIGQIPSSFLRRETRQSDQEVRVSRMIDRALRPLLNQGERREIHLTVQVLSADPAIDLIGLSITSSSLVLHCSSLPFAGPVWGEALVSQVGEAQADESGDDDQERLSQSGSEAGFNLVSARANQQEEWVIALHQEGIVMLEGGVARDLVPASTLIHAFNGIREERSGVISQLIELTKGLVSEKSEIKQAVPIQDAILGDALPELTTLMALPNPAERANRYEALFSTLLNQLDVSADALSTALSGLARGWIREEILNGRRRDGRALNELRAFEVTSGVLPQSSGSSLMTRGATQVLTSVTVGKAGEAPLDDRIYGQRRLPLFCHYHFPGYATRQQRLGRIPNRREIGHGLLIQRALSALSNDEAGRCLRVISDVLEADGSSSMASVIGANIALAEAEAPLREALVGLSVGLVSEGERATLLLDLTGEEDMFGDMDLKVIGGASGLCALQLDNKLGALPWEVIEAAISLASEAHIQLLPPVLEAMREFEIPEPAFSQTLQLDPQRLGQVIGPRGAHIREVERSNQVRIQLDRDRGIATISGDDEDGVMTAVVDLMTLSEPLKNGHIYYARIEDVKPYGVFVKFAQHSGLVHITELREGGGDAREHFNSGEELPVKLLGTDKQGRLKLSHLAAR